MYPVTALRAQTVAPGRIYYPGLDALRGLAVLSVLLFHLFPSNRFFGIGWIGVDFFFVISGFLITSILLQSNKGQGYFKNFYTRRLLRILPLSFALLLVFFLGVTFFDQGNRLAFYRQNWWYYFLFVQNWLFYAKGLPQEYYLNHFWSLAVEEQFYLFFPLLVYAVSKRRLVQIIFVLIPVVLCLRVAVWTASPGDFARYYCSTFTRADSLLFGCLLGCGVRFQINRLSLVLLVLTVGVLAAGILFYQSVSFKNPFLATIGYTLVALVFYAFLSIYTGDDHSFFRLRKSPLLNYIGKISYGLYLIHVPVYLVVTALCAKAFGNFATELLAGSISLTLTLVLSSFSYYAFERHFLRLKDHFSAQPSAALGGPVATGRPAWYAFLFRQLRWTSPTS